MTDTQHVFNQGNKTDLESAEHKSGNHAVAPSLERHGSVDQTPFLHASASCVPDVHGHCPVCQDEALAVEVVAVNEQTALATVWMDRGNGDNSEMNGQMMEVDISLVDGVVEGQMLWVHGGVALQRVDGDAV